MPIGFVSRTLNDAERKYDTYSREALAIVFTISKFKPYLMGNRFTVYTDHKPLLYFRNSTDPNSRVSRYQFKLSCYDFEIKYKEGSTNVVADCLSRNPIVESINTIETRPRRATANPVNYKLTRTYTKKKESSEERNTKDETVPKDTEEKASEKDNEGQPYNANDIISELNPKVIHESKDNISLHNSGEQWFRSLPEIIDAPQPEILSPTEMPKWQYITPESLAIGGIYSEKDTRKLRDLIVFPLEKGAVLNKILRGATGQEVKTDGISISPFLKFVHKILVEERNVSAPT
uniref:Reverse transcriptase RNase H-like domain-containing protein n=1 Tax=Trichogramma kaykai TaxID=54128 RepID=A0ABD2WYV3_9HYME